MELKVQLYLCLLLLVIRHENSSCLLWQNVVGFISLCATFGPGIVDDGECN